MKKSKVTDISIFYRDSGLPDHDGIYVVCVVRDHDVNDEREYEDVSNFVLDKLEDLTHKDEYNTTIHITRGTPAIFISPV